MSAMEAAVYTERIQLYAAAGRPVPDSAWEIGQLQFVPEVMSRTCPQHGSPTLMLSHKIWAMTLPEVLRHGAQYCLTVDA